MLTLILPHEQHELLLAALRKAGWRGVGGILMGEHVRPNLFIGREMIVHRRGAFASFVRRIEGAIGRLRAFLQQTGHDYTRFNYSGEWHSHPSSAPYPSRTDDMSMLQIVQDEAVCANFAVLLIAKLGLEGALVATVHAYLPGGMRIQSSIKLQTGEELTV